MMELMQSAASLGVGALFGLVVFFVYRTDRKDSERRILENRLMMEDRLSKILLQDQLTREMHTKALTELTTLLVRLNGRLK